MRRKAKAVLKEAAKKSYSDKLKTAKPIGRKLYTDSEKEELAQLRKQRDKFKRQLDRITANSKITLKQIRRLIPNDLARELYYIGAFSPDTYDTKDYREILSDFPSVLETVNENIQTLAPELLQEMDPSSEEYSTKIAELNEKIAVIRNKAIDRKELEKLKLKVDKIQSKQDYKDALTLIDRIDKAGGAISALNEGEKATVDFVKRQLAGVLINKLDFGDMDEAQAGALKATLYKTIAFNPKEGIREYIKQSVSAKVVEKFGNDAGDLSNSLINLATGKGDLRFVGLSLFKGVVNRSSLNPSVMSEKAEELIAAGESTEEKENMKRLGRDVVVDIAKDIIKSGGNVYAAIPMMLKDIALDTGRAYMRKKK